MAELAQVPRVLINPYLLYECPDCEVRVAVQDTEDPMDPPACPKCSLLPQAMEFVGLCQVALVADLRVGGGA